MKFTIIFVSSAFAFSSLALGAQQLSAGAGQNASASTNGAQVHESAGTQANANRSADGSAQAGSSTGANAETRPVKCELVGKLDSKSAKVNEPVVVKTREKMKTSSGVEIPKGSRLVGHVTQVEAHGSGHSDSSMGIVFDRAELKDGQNVAIHSVIESVAPPVSAAESGALDSDAALSGPMGSGPMGGGVGGGRVAGGGRAGGGLLGGAAGATGSAAGGLTPNLNTTAGGATRSTAGLAGETASNVGGSLRETAGATGSLTADATGMPGVMLAGSASSLSSGTLSAAGKNIHLDSGTQMVLGVSAISSLR
jgi:hypothetical protein